MNVMFETCPESAPFFGFMGVAASIVFANLGAAYGTAKSGVGLSSMGVMNPHAIMKNVLPVIMSGVLGIYGLIVSVVIMTEIKGDYSSYNGFAHLASGLSIGLSSLAAGFCLGISGDAGVRAVGQQPKVYTGMILMLIFGEALSLYGLVVALLLSQMKKPCTPA